MTAVGFSACLAGAAGLDRAVGLHLRAALHHLAVGAALPHAARLPRRHAAEPARAPAGRRHVLQRGGRAPGAGAVPGHRPGWDSRRTRCSSRATATSPITLSRSRYWFALVLIAALVVILARRWAAARGSQRQALAPVLVSGGLVMALLGSLVRGAARARRTTDFVRRLEDARYVVLAHGAVRLPGRAPAQPRRRRDGGQRGGRPARGSERAPRRHLPRARRRARRHLARARLPAIPDGEYVDAAGGRSSSRPQGRTGPSPRWSRAANRSR